MMIDNSPSTKQEFMSFLQKIKRGELFIILDEAEHREEFESFGGWWRSALCDDLNDKVTSLYLATVPSFSTQLKSGRVHPPKIDDHAIILDLIVLDMIPESDPRYGYKSGQASLNLTISQSEPFMKIMEYLSSTNIEEITNIVMLTNKSHEIEPLIRICELLKNKEFSTLDEEL